MRLGTIKPKMGVRVLGALLAKIIMGIPTKTSFLCHPLLKQVKLKWVLKRVLMLSIKEKTPETLYLGTSEAFCWRSGRPANHTLSKFTNIQKQALSPVNTGTLSLLHFTKLY